MSLVNDNSVYLVTPPESVPINISDYVGADSIESQRIFQFNIRANAFKRRWGYYFGNQIPRSFKRKGSQPDLNVKFNLMQLVADKAVAFLFGKDVAISLDSSDLETSDAEEWLNNCWEINKKSILLQDLALFGAINGHCFILISNQEKLYPKLTAIDPEFVDMVANPDDKSDIQKYIIEYPRLDEKTGKVGKYRKVIAQSQLQNAWEITEYEKFSDTNSPSIGWLITNEETWPYPFAPILDCPNLPAPGSIWGLPDITDDLLDLNNSLNSVYSDLRKIVFHHSSPKFWAKGINADEVDVAVDNMTVLPGEKASMGLLEMSASGLVPALDLAARLKDAIHELSHTPQVDPAKLASIGNLSGLALQVMYTPLLERTELKRQRYGYLIQEISRRLLGIAGYRYGFGYVPRLTWPDLLPKDPTAVGQEVQTLDQLGLASKQTLAAQFGLDYAAELSRMTVEAKQRMLLIQLDQALGQEDITDNVKQ